MMGSSDSFLKLSPPLLTGEGKGMSPKEQENPTEGEVVESKDPTHMATADMAEGIMPPMDPKPIHQKVQDRRDNAILFMRDQVTGLEKVDQKDPVNVGTGENVVGMEEAAKEDQKGTDEAPIDTGADLEKADAEQKRLAARQRMHARMNSELDEGTKVQGHNAKAIRQDGKPAVIVPAQQMPLPQVQPPAAPTVPPVVSPAAEAGDALANLAAAGEKQEVTEEEVLDLSVVEQEAGNAAGGEDGEGAGGGEGNGGGEGGDDEGGEDGGEGGGEERMLNQEEAQAELDSGRSEADDLALVAELKAQFVAQAEMDKAAILEDAEAKKAMVQAAAAVQAERINAHTKATIRQIRKHHGGIRGGLKLKAEASKKELQQKLDTAIADAKRDTKTKWEKFQGDLEYRRKDFKVFIEDAKAAPTKIAMAEADRFDREIDRSKGEVDRDARHVKSTQKEEEGKESDQRQAVDELGTSAKQDMEDKKPGMREELLGKTADYGGNFDEYLTLILGQIDDVESSSEPEFQKALDNTIEGLKTAHQAVIQKIDTQLENDLKRISTNEGAAVKSVEKASAETLQKVDMGSGDTQQSINDTATQAILSIDETVAATVAIIDGAEEVYVPGVMERLDTTKVALAETRNTSITQTQTLVDGLLPELETMGTMFIEQTTAGAENANKGASAIMGAAIQSLAAIVEGFGTEIKDVLKTHNDNLDGLSSEILKQLDPEIVKAKDEVNKTNLQFKNDAAQSVDDGLVEARKPLTDLFVDRAIEAWIEAGAPWWAGVLGALWDIVKGLALIIVLAVLLIVVVAVLFGTVLTLWTAMMIVGLVMLTVAFVGAYMARSQQEGVKSPFFAALSDAIGVTGLWRGIGNEDIPWGTGEKLNLPPSKRWREGINGGFTLIGVFLMGRGAVKGPPGGAYTKPAALPKNWVGWKGGWKAAGPSFKYAMGELQGGLFEIGGSIWKNIRNPRQAVSKFGQSIVQKALNVREMITSPKGGLSKAFSEWYNGKAPLALMLKYGQEFIASPLKTAKSTFEGFTAQVKPALKNLKNFFEKPEEAPVESGKGTETPNNQSGNESTKGEEKVEKTEEKVDKTEEKVEKVEEKVDKAEEKVDKAEEKVDKTEEKVDKTEEKVDKAEEKVDKAEEKTEQNENKTSEKDPEVLAERQRRRQLKKDKKAEGKTKKAEKQAEKQTPVEETAEAKAAREAAEKKRAEDLENLNRLVEEEMKVAEQEPNTSGMPAAEAAKAKLGFIDRLLQRIKAQQGRRPGAMKDRYERLYKEVEKARLLAEEDPAAALKKLDDLLPRVKVAHQAQVLRDAIEGLGLDVDALYAKNLSWGDYKLTIGEGLTIEGEYVSLSGKLGTAREQMAGATEGPLKGKEIPPDLDPQTAKFKDKAHRDPAKKEPGGDGAVDAEAKFVEDLLNRMGQQAGKTFEPGNVYPEVTGEITINTEMVTCSRCASIVNQLKEMFPNAKPNIKVNSGVEYP